MHKTRPDLVLDAADAYQTCLDITKERAPIKRQYVLQEHDFSLSKIDIRYDTCIMCHVLEHLRRPIEAINEAFLFRRSTSTTSPLERIEELVGIIFPGWSFSNIAVVTR